MYMTIPYWRVVNTAVVRITRVVIAFTPIGVFAIVAATPGTVSPETLQRLEVCFVAFAAASLQRAAALTDDHARRYYAVGDCLVSGSRHGDVGRWSTCEAIRRR